MQPNGRGFRGGLDEPSALGVHGVVSEGVGQPPLRAVQLDLAAAEVALVAPPAGVAHAEPRPLVAGAVSAEVGAFGGHFWLGLGGDLDGVLDGVLVGLVVPVGGGRRRGRLEDAWKQRGQDGEDEEPLPPVLEEEGGHFGSGGHLLILDALSK